MYVTQKKLGGKGGKKTSGTHRQITAGFVMAREAGITSFTK